MAGLLEEYRRGRRQTGRVVDGVLIDETAETIAGLEVTIANLDRVLEEANAQRP